jgi:UDP-N-acetylglucosamine 4,6-dehydratase (inverting)
LNGKSILITGGTGSFGNALVSYLLKNYPKIKRLVIFSRDENKQFEMQKIYSPLKFKCLRYFIGDIRDGRRLRIALDKIDFVFHAAAMKQVPASEYNPSEAIKTNIDGAQNLIDASLEKNVKKVIFLSTDKACSPINLYGATKLCAEKLFLTAKKNSPFKNTKFVVLRYGNVNASRGSVMPYFIEKSKSKILPVTQKDMTRFSIRMNEAIEMSMWALKYLDNGQILIPKIPSYKVVDLARAFKGSKIKYVGIRHGEKVHEDLISKPESRYAMETNKYFILYPNVDQKKFRSFQKKIKAKIHNQEFNYNSESNKNFLKINQLSKIINEIKKIN